MSTPNDQPDTFPPPEATAEMPDAARSDAASAPGVTPLLINRKEAARMLCIGTKKLWELTNAGRIPHVRIDRSIRYRPQDLADWIEKQVKGGRA